MKKNYKLIAARNAKEYTQVDMAEKLGVCIDTYNAYENKRFEPKLSTIIKILDILDEDFDNIFLQEG